MKLIDILELFDYTSSFVLTVFDDSLFTKSIDIYFDKVLVINSDNYSEYLGEYVLNGIVKNIFVGNDIIYLYIQVDDLKKIEG